MPRHIDPNQQLIEDFFDPDDLRKLKADMEAGAFQSVDESLETEYRCPACAYEWSGQPKPSIQDAEAGSDSESGADV